MRSKILSKEFYERDTKEVAKDLLGKILVRRLNNKVIYGKIIETEAYYGKEDPASRVSLGRPKYCVEQMYGDVGKTLIYMVHANWLLNIVSHEKNKVGAILIRSLKVLYKSNLIINGPGRLTKFLKIDLSLNNLPVYEKNGKILILDNNEKFEIQCSNRIGVKKDLKEKLRFFIKNNH